MWNNALDIMLRRLMRNGTLDVTMPDGGTRRYGDGTGTPIAVALHDAQVPRRIVLNPELGVGEAYMDGKLTIEGDDLRGLLTLAISNMARRRDLWGRWQMNGLRTAFRWLQQFNPVNRATKNVAHHYDLSAELYDLFLDADKQYSCGYFRDPAMTLEEAQAAKKAHIAGKLLLRPGMRVLDIGCGWGGLALTLARDHDVHVVGVTLSREQHKIANERARAEGLDDRVEFRLTDYRNVAESFDRVVSVGMFEHVGVPHYREYFRHVRERLTEDGVALIHTIGRASPPGTTSPWIAKYIFPGGYVPALSETMTAIEREDLIETDIEIWRLHYAETLRHWHDRFVAREDEARALFDERFCRMWRYYLLAAELTFRLNRQIVFQLQLARQLETVPITRDYLYAGEQAARPRMAAE